VRYSVQQVPWIIEAAAVEVDGRCTAHQEIVFLWRMVGRGEGVEGKYRHVLKNAAQSSSASSIIIAVINNSKQNKMNIKMFLT